MIHSRFSRLSKYTQTNSTTRKGDGDGDRDGDRNGDGDISGEHIHGQVLQDS